MEKQITESCRYCKHEIIKGVRRCPYCGVLNPTLKMKDIFVTIAVIIFIMSIVTYLK
ncbi:MAG: hypothetical protein KAQ94_06185 [Arcobacteraceae bacterium]|nr:hypothetical protein [Arcobacteraceae bacterium]